MSKKALKIVKKTRKCAKSAYNSSKTLLLVISVFCSLVFPHHSIATIATNSTPDGLFGQIDEPSPSILFLENKDIDVVIVGSNIFPIPTDRIPKKYMVSVSAYNSEVAQTDASPCITANGFNLCEHDQEDVIATNMFAFGTKVKIPSIDSDRVFTVVDRMNSRYQNHVDIWMKDRGDAIQFGRKTLEIQVY
ncbi:MAG: hypothetical protein PHH83_00190 [Patescibacteria group bacterium]|nr:hypothetical protein [Patescibacteria group bacterium]